MRVRARWIAVALALLLLFPLAGGESGSHLTRRVTQLVASPTPVAGVTLLDDAHAWRVDLPVGVCVMVVAHEAGLAPFVLRAANGDDAVDTPNPGFDQSLVLPAPVSAPGSWTVTLDPVAGGPVDVMLSFDGRYVDCAASAPASFSLWDVSRAPPCVDGAGACLP